MCVVEKEWERKEGKRKRKSEAEVEAQINTEPRRDGGRSFSRRKQHM